MEMANRKRNIRMQFYVTEAERRIGMEPAREVRGGKYGLSHPRKQTAQVPSVALRQAEQAVFRRSASRFRPNQVRLISQIATA